MYQKIFPVDCLPDRILLGRQTENGVRQIRIDCQPWLVQWPELAVSIWVTPAGGAESYPANAALDGDILEWTISSADTANAGDGTMEVVGLLDGIKTLSAIAMTYVTASTTASPGTTPEAYTGWVDQVLAAGAEAKDSAELAAASEEKAAQYAEEAMASACQAEESKTLAADSTAVAVGSAANAKQSADEAALSESNAKQSADAAARSVTQASGYADAAGTAAVTAQEFSVTAGESAEAAMMHAQAAQAVADSIPDDYSALSTDAAQVHEIVLSAYPDTLPNEMFVVGGLQPDTGGTNSLTTRWRTCLIPVGEYVISAQDGVVYTVFSYKVESGTAVSYLGMSDNTSGDSLLAPLLKEGADAFAVRGAFTDNRNVTEDDFALLTICQQVQPMVRPLYDYGGIIAASGVETNPVTRVRTDFFPAEPLYVVPDEGYKFLLMYYDENKTYLSAEATDWLSEPRLLTVPDKAAYIRIAAAYDDDRVAYGSGLNPQFCCGWRINLYTAQSTEYLAACLDSQNADPYTTYVSDVPENIGVLNTILNMKQMADIRYTPLATIPQKTTDLVAGTTYKGMVYSSSRPEMGFVPNCVSLHTFMTAVQNPNSYLYTVDLGELGNENGHTYYGSVCSTMICAALGIKEVYQTAQWADIPGMKPLDWQSPHALKLGDVVCTKAMGHVLMVTDITRNKRGKIGTITTMETGSYLPYTKTFTPDEFEAAYPTASWVYYRYERIYEAKHVQSPYVAVEDEVPQTVVYNTALIPRKGDKANWLAGVPVEIDVLEAGSYTAVEVYKDDALYSTVDVAALITLADLPYGSYKARLTDGTNTSDWCYWMVVDAVSTVTTTGNTGEIKVDFSASNATPVYVTWCRAEDNYPRYISTPTADELAAGSAVCVHKSGNFKVRVAFETEYGIIHTVLPDAVTVY